MSASRKVDWRDRDRLAATEGPVPLILLERPDVEVRLLAALRNEPRFEIIAVNALTPRAASLANRAAGMIIATLADPMSALLLALSAGVTTAIVVAAPADPMECREVEEAGAAACLRLPIQPSEVALLVDVLRASRPILRVEPTSRLLVDPISHVVHYRNASVKLTPREFALLHRLSIAAGRPVATTELLQSVWGDDQSPGLRPLLTVYVFQLRRKLEIIGRRAQLKTVRGFGYVLERDA